LVRRCGWKTRLDMTGLSGLMNPNQQNQKQPNMPIKFLGKVLFPHLAPWQRTRQAKIMVAVILITVVLAAIIVAIMFFQNGRR
jgi:hypothetical protein